MKVISILGLALAFAGCADDKKMMKEPVSKPMTTNVSVAPPPPPAAPAVEAPKMEDKKMAAAGTVTCTLPGASDERTISVVTPDNGGCAVRYTKNGEANDVANAVNDMSYCDNVQKKIENNLTVAGFNCSAQ